jgi:DNA-directed RNA polymerase specialized sigma24 family protein
VQPFGLRWRVRPRRILPVHLATSDTASNPKRAAAVQSLARLERPLREVVALCDMAGLTYEESAAVLHVRTRTIGIRLGRGRLRFAAAYQRARRVWISY